METRKPPRSKLLRRLLPALVGLALLGASLPGCEWPARTRFVHPVFSDIDTTTGITYRSTTRWNGEPIDLKLDVFEPRGDTRAVRPVIMWMFGGGWRAGDRDQLKVLAQDSAKRGFVGVTIDYRIRNDQDPFDISAAELDAYDDSIAAIQWLKDNAATYRIDPDVIVPAGISAGAINALHDVYRPGTRGPTTTPAAGAVSASGVSFVTPPAGRPPVLMTHGTQDTIVPFSAAQRMCAASESVGNQCIFHPFDGGHQFPPGFSDDAHNFVFERILLAHGYEAEEVPEGA